MNIRVEVMSFLHDAKIICEQLDDYLKVSVAGEGKVIDQPPITSIIDELKLEKWVTEGGLSHNEFKDFIATYLSYATRLHHPGYLGHQCAPSHYSGALAALMDGCINSVMSIYEMGPGAATLEFFMINWMLNQIGWQPQQPDETGVNINSSGAGVFVHGGSLANLLALVVARKKVLPDIMATGNAGDLAILVPADCHYSITKSAAIMGIGAQAIYNIPTDDQGKIISQQLPQVLDEVLADGMKPMALVANACSTSVGAYDPLASVAAFCQKQQLWLHVDGAHGASALLSAKHKNKLQGIQAADSVTWDAHKMLKTPSLSAALLVKERKDLATAMHHDASYLFHDKDQPGIDFIQRSVECTKPAIASKLFFVLAAVGEQGLAEYIDHQYDLTTQAYQYLQTQGDFECACAPESNILCIRITGSDAHQLAIRARLLAKGGFYLTTVVFKSKQYLRLVFMNENSSMHTVKQLLSEIRAASQSINGQNN